MKLKVKGRKKMRNNEEDTVVPNPNGEPPKTNPNEKPTKKK